MRTPSASSVSAPPASDDEALLPCLIGTETVDVVGTGPDLLGGQPAAVLQHHVGQFGHFCCGWRLHLHSHGEGRELRRRRRSGHDLLHGPAGLSARQILTRGQNLEHSRPRQRHFRGPLKWPRR
jgi:hypothetical protein